MINTLARLDVVVKYIDTNLSDMQPDVSVVLSQQALLAYPDFTFSQWINLEDWGQFQFEIYPSAVSGVDVVMEFSDDKPNAGLQEVIKDMTGASTTGNDLIVPIKRQVWRWASASPWKLPIPNGNNWVRIGVAGAAGNVSVILKRISQSTN